MVTVEISVFNARIKENERIIKSCEDAIRDLKRLIVLEKDKEKAYIYKEPMPNINLED